MSGSTGLVGREIERYEVVELLRGGDRAAEYRVRHTTLNSEHTLKVIQAGVRGGQMLERLRQQGEVQAQLRHENILPVTDILDIDGQPGLIVKRFESVTLRAWIKSEEPDIPTALAVFEDILSGVRVAHRAGLVHRDLTPDSIVMVRSEGRLVPKIADFGLVKVLGSAGLGTASDLMGSSIHGSCYVSPEQLADPSNVDARTDMHALGCILFHMLAHQPPYRDDHVIRLLDKVNNGTYPDPEVAVPGIPAHVVELIRGLMATARDERLPDCDVALHYLRKQPGTASAGWARDTTADAPAAVEPAAAPPTMMIGVAVVVVAIVAGVALFAMG